MSTPDRPMIGMGERQGKEIVCVYRLMTDAEVAQLQTDRATFAAEAQAAAKVAADRQALLAKLKTGTATPAEIQTILAQLLGG